MSNKKYKFIKIYKTEYDDIVKYKKSGEIPQNLNYSIRKKIKLFDLRDNKLFYEDKEVIPLENINETIDSVYNDCNYFGLDKLFHLIRRKYHGISRNDVMNYLRNNETHQIHSRPIMKKAILQPIITTEPRERLQIDFIEISDKKKGVNLNFRYILTCIDVFSKYAFCFPTRNKEKNTYLPLIESLFEKYKFKILQSDKEFKSNKLKELCDKYNVNQIFSKAYHPQSNGCIERFNKTLKEQIHKYLTNSGSKVWINALPKIVENYNNSYHSTIKMTPHECFHGSKRTIQRASRGIKKQAKKFLKNITQINKFDNFKVGDYVRVLLTNKSKLDKGYKQNYSRPIFRIKQINNLKNGVRSFILDNNKSVFFANQMMKVDKKQLIEPKQIQVEEKYFDREKHLERARQKRKKQSKNVENDNYDDFHIYFEQSD